MPGAGSPHGGRFLYRSAETDVLGWVCERAAGRQAVELTLHAHQFGVAERCDARIGIGGVDAQALHGLAHVVARERAADLGFLGGAHLGRQRLLGADDPGGRGGGSNHHRQRQRTDQQRGDYEFSEHGGTPSSWNGGGMPQPA